MIREINHNYNGYGLISRYVGKYVEKQALPCIADGNVNWYKCYEDNLSISIKIIIYALINTFLPGIYPLDLFMCLFNDTGTRLL